jgi:DNA polymerase-3 subunit epsilon
MKQARATHYAVVDVETTGFSPKHHHRVIEIAVIRLNETGEITDEFDTLINPNRDVGPV